MIDQHQLFEGAEPVKILTVKQPWAWLIVAGHKDVENRSWMTYYRGPVLIHAGARPDADIDAIRSDVRRRFGIEIPRDLPLGGVVGIVTVCDCRSSSGSVWHEADSFGWMLSDPRPLAYVAHRGMLGLTSAGADLLDKLRL